MYCHFSETFINLVTKLKKLICVDRNGDWEGHLHVFQELMPVFRESDSINYLCYVSRYLYKMWLLPKEHPVAYHQFLRGSFVVQTTLGSFIAVSPDMKLE